VISCIQHQLSYLPITAIPVTATRQPALPSGMSAHSCVSILCDFPAPTTHLENQSAASHLHPSEGPAATHYELQALRAHLVTHWARQVVSDRCTGTWVETRTKQASQPPCWALAFQMNAAPLSEAVSDVGLMTKGRGNKERRLNI
jgi:hypothetical protein